MGHLATMGKSTSLMKPFPNDELPLFLQNTVIDRPSLAHFSMIRKNIISDRGRVSSHKFLSIVKVKPATKVHAVN
jgi:hypothetical protein